MRQFRVQTLSRYRSLVTRYYCSCAREPRRPALRGLSTKGTDETRMTSEKVVRQFESPTVVQYYSEYRPTYPKQLVEKIFSFSARHGVGNNMAVDLACGSGQSTFELTDRFYRTVGVDISNAQIECAKEKATALGKNTNVEFLVSPASNLPFEDESVDLILCAMAWHWLDPDTLFPEIDRVLKPPGVLAVLSYSCPRLRHRQCDELFYNFFLNTCVWSYENVKTHIVGHYRDVKLPYPLAERHDMLQESKVSLESLSGFVKSWGTYKDLCKQYPGNSALEDMLQEMRRSLLGNEIQRPVESLNKVQLSDITVDLDTPFFLLLMAKS